MSEKKFKIPVPEINEETQHFWDATAEGKLLVKKCGDCNEYHYYPRTICPFCMSDNTEWVQSSGKGTVYTYSVMRRSPVQYCIAYVTLDEGITMMTNLVDVDLDKIEIGMDVQVAFVDTGEGCALPYFTGA
ncbi:MAG: Zn-ribbon domain-containing OB-fold protein [Gammaproteobacteria bacterium]|nr:Zn-ribbon domain-containing OB-fold protein [Gammaproteobacteria bacterium]